MGVARVTLGLMVCLSACDAGVGHDTELKPPSPGAPALSHVDWTQEGDAAFTDLVGYLKVDTANPPGNELLGAQYLSALLERAEIPSEIDRIDPDREPTRANLYARLTGDGTGGGPICLVSHIDVVTAERERWPRDRGPFSGAIERVETGHGQVEEVAWGRGAVDMKTLGILQVALLRIFKREHLRLRRDLILLAVADEEVDKLGMQHVVNSRWSELACTHAINEGGLAVHDAFFPGQTVFAISVGERGLSWLRMVGHGKPGHASVPVPDSAPSRLIEALALLSHWQAPARATPALYELLASVGRDQGGLPGLLMTRPWLVDTFVLRKLYEQPLSRALVADTVNITGFGGLKQPNVVPAQVFAQIDARLLPGTSPAEMLQELKSATKGTSGISFEVIAERPAAVSTWDDPLYRALARHAPSVVDPGRRVVVGPIVSPGFTDSISLREKGVRAYGFMPVALSKEEAGTAHGDNERISKTNVTRGLRALALALAEVSTHAQ